MFKSKGNAGKHTSSCPSYGYLKSEADKNQWVVDYEAAEIVRRIFWVGGTSDTSDSKVRSASQILWTSPRLKFTLS